MNIKRTVAVFALLFILTAAATVSAEERPFLLNKKGGPIEVKPNLELGFFGFFSHTIKFGAEGDTFNYVKEGGQNILFPFQRLSVDFTIKDRHSLIFLYQPINVLTNVVLERSIRMEDITFTSGTPMNLRYGFDFYRVSYMYDVLRSPSTELGLGFSLQMRDAVIDFKSADGEQAVDNRGIGPVPILKVRFRQDLGRFFWLGAEADGFYASNRFVNGSLEDEFVGSILDASLRGGYRVSDAVDVFLNIRYLGGGATGTETDELNDGDGDDGYVSNTLNAFSLSAGVSVK